MFSINKINSGLLLDWKKSKKEFQFIDIRTNKQAINFHHSELTIPFDILKENISKIRSDIPVVLACDTGDESFFMAVTLKEKHNFGNIYSLSGGINELKTKLTK